MKRTLVNRMNLYVKKSISAKLKLSDDGLRFITLGSAYGSKTLFVDSNNPPINVLSAGVGEDISWDIELIHAFSSKVFLVDPTERAIQHYEQIRFRFGSSSNREYSQTGCQNPESYDLSGIDIQRLIHIPKALWWHSRRVSFFPPANPEHVSFSIRNIQSSSTDPVKVDSITISKIERSFKVKFDLVKLDIEGAALEVIVSLLLRLNFPNQIIIEFEELIFPSMRNSIRATLLVFLLKCAGYIPVFNESGIEVTYLRRRYIEFLLLK